MNQHQRKFLLEAVEKQYQKEKGAIEARKPKPPSLNNYLIAAILDGSFVMKGQEAVRQLILERVRSLGKSDTLLDGGSVWGKRPDESTQTINLPADLLFELPIGYANSFEKYMADLKAWQQEMDSLESAINSMRIKVQIGSDKALEALVEQADKLCSMSLTNSSQLMLGNK